MAIHHVQTQSHYLQDELVTVIPPFWLVYIYIYIYMYIIAVYIYMYIHTIYSSPILSALSSSCLVDVCWGYLENLYSLKINILTTSLQTT